MATSTQMKKLKKYWKLTIIVENNFFELPVTIAKIVLTREPSPIHAENWAVITTMSPSAWMLYTRPSSTILFISWKYAQINQFWPSLFSSTGIVSSSYSPPY